MAENRTYKVIVSDRAKRMLGTHIRFMAQINKDHKLFVEKWYLILYQIRDNTVYVEYILDCRKDYSWLIR